MINPLDAYSRVIASILCKQISKRVRDLIREPDRSGSLVPGALVAIYRIGS